MERKNNTHITLSDIAYYKYYDQKNFISLFGYSVLHSGYPVLIELAISFLLGAICFFLINISYIDRPREFIATVCTGIMTYSITTIGFLLVSFTMVIVLNSSKSFFRYFAIEDSNYKSPLMKIILGFFIIPIGIFVLLLIFSMLISFTIPIYNVNQFSLVEKNIIIKFFIGIIIFLFTLSIIEFLSFFYNIYKFIVLTSYDMANNFEQSVIKATILNDMILDDGSTEIEKNIREKIEKIKKEENEVVNA